MSAQSLPFHDQARAKKCKGLNLPARAVGITPAPCGRTVFGQQSKALPQDIGILTAHLVDKEAGLALANTAQTSAVKLD